MKRASALLLSAAVLLPCSCISVGGGWADNWSAPAPIGEPGSYTGVDVSCIAVAPLAYLGCRLPSSYLLTQVYVEYSQYSDGDEEFTSSNVACDLGQIACILTGDPLRLTLRKVHWWPILKPVLGRYDWSESPEGPGLLTGLTAGVGVLVKEGWGGVDWGVCLRLEYGWLHLHDASADGDARLQVGKVSLIWIPSPP